MRTIKSTKIKTLVYLAGLILLLGACATSTNDSSEAAVQETCPDLLSGDKFQAAFIRSSACDSLNDVDLVYEYKDDACTKNVRMVDMSIYIRMAIEDTCTDNKTKIYTYRIKE